MSEQPAVERPADRDSYVAPAVTVLGTLGELTLATDSRTIPGYPGLSV